VPGGLLPALELDGRLYTESAAIATLLEREFPQLPLMPPPGSTARRAADAHLRLERQLFSAWMGWLTSARSDAQQRAAFEAPLAAVEEALGGAGGPFFLGAELSLVDITFAPFLERMAASLLYYKGFALRAPARPRLAAWFAAMEARPTYAAIQSDFYTHAHDLPPQLGGCEFNQAGPAHAALIDGEARGPGSNWHLPLPPLSAHSSEPYSAGEVPARDRLQAAARLIGNRAAITRFAARGCGARGSRPVAAPLADPTATPGEAYLADVDAALRLTAHQLLAGDGGEGARAALRAAAAPGAMRAQPAAAAAVYLRDRVGVPRDLRFPAARQLRAHLNAVIDALQG